MVASAWSEPGRAEEGRGADVSRPHHGELLLKRRSQRRTARPVTNANGCHDGETVPCESVARVRVAPRRPPAPAAERGSSCRCDAGFTGNGFACCPRLRFPLLPLPLRDRRSNVPYRRWSRSPAAPRFWSPACRAQIDDPGLPSGRPPPPDRTAGFHLDGGSGVETPSRSSFHGDCPPRRCWPRRATRPTDPRGASARSQRRFRPSKGAALVVPQGALDGATQLTISSLPGLPPPPTCRSRHLVHAHRVRARGRNLAQPVRLFCRPSPAMLATARRCSRSTPRRAAGCRSRIERVRCCEWRCGGRANVSLLAVRGRAFDARVRPARRSGRASDGVLRQSTGAWHACAALLPFRLGRERMALLIERRSASPTCWRSAGGRRWQFTTRIDTR